MNLFLRLGRPFLIWSFILVLVSFGSGEAGIGFKRTPPSEQLATPFLLSGTKGFSSAIADSIPADTVSIDSLIVKPIEVKVEPRGTSDIVLPDTSTSSSTTVPIEPLLVDSLMPVKPDTLLIHADGTPAPILVDSLIADTSQKEKPLLHRSTRLFQLDIPVETTVELDSTTEYLLMKQNLHGSDMPATGAISRDGYLTRATQSADRESWQKSVRDRLPVEKDSEGSGIVISIPIIRSGKKQQKFDRWVERTIGGNDVTLTVAGNVRVDGDMRVEKREEIRQENESQTSYQFKVNQTQQFEITGKVGEKVTVEIDQNSERLFDFENNLKVRYDGEEGEIIQSIEAGNVNLSLRGAKLASASTQNKGLFGFKTTAQFGALSLTTIASLEKAQKNQITIEGGAQTGRPIRINPNDFVQGRYFFLDTLYRENYRKRSGEDLRHIVVPLAQSIDKIEVYVSVLPNDPDRYIESIGGWAFYDPTVHDSTSDDQLYEYANWYRLDIGEYLIERDLGYIRLERPVQNETALAVAYLRGDSTLYGDVDPLGGEDSLLVLKLLKPSNPQPPSEGATRSTWELMWRNVYSLGSAGIDREGFEGKITGLDENGIKSDSRVDTLGNSRTFIEIFGLDNFGSEGQAQADGKIDDEFIDYAHGELIFPDLHPFAPEGWVKIELPDEPIRALLDDSLFSPGLYTEPPSGLNDVVSDFEIEAKYKSVSSVYELGYNVLEGSEEVYRGGVRLTRGRDYTIDYLTGKLNLVGVVTAADNIEIRYEKGQLFQLATKTLLGMHAEYELWEDSYIGTTLLSFNEKTLDQRVQVGGEPTQNSIWDINTKLTFKPEFLTRAADWLPLIETDKESTFSLSGEIAQVFPNPNSLNSPSTGDNNGVAYLDDFESIRRSTPLGVSQKQWTPASFPEYDRYGPLQWNKQRGRLIWYNPVDQVLIKDIFPERETQATNATIPVLTLEYQPWWTAWKGNKPEGTNARKSWAGVMRYLGSGYADQSKSKYLEIWLERPPTSSGVMYVDLGKLSEDVIPDGKLNSEDTPTGGKQYGDGILEQFEDVGLDGVAGDDPTDLSEVNERDVFIPSYDDWHYSSSDKKNYSRTNGTEGNGSSAGEFQEGGKIPDSEDLNGNNYLDTKNSFLRYKIDFSERDNNRYIVGGKNNPNNWRLYRIPLIDTLSVDDGKLTTMEFVRVWFTDFEQQTKISIAEMDIVGNEWRELEVEDGTGELKEPIRVAVTNTHDNPDTPESPGYYPPPGVAGEIDPITNLRGQEQSLVLRINDLGRGESGEVEKILHGNRDLLQYRRLKMYVNGGGTTDPQRFRELDLWMYLRFGNGSKKSARYYEYSQRLKPGWDEDNEIIIDFDRLASLKFLRQQDSLNGRDYDILPNGDVIRIVGEPSLDDIGFLTLGVQNHGRSISSEEKIEIWVDELRVSDVKKHPGWAATGGFDLRIAQSLFTLDGNITHKQADFHNVQSKNTTGDNSLDGSLGASFALDELLDQQWGLKLPLRADIYNKVTVPKYQPGSDIELSSISGKQMNIWSTFNDNIWSNDRLKKNPADYDSPIDSMIATNKWYKFSFSASKSKKSENHLIRYTVDGLNLGSNFKESWVSSHTYQSQYDRTISGNTGYNLSFDKPIEWEWLSWTSSIPVVNKVSESKFKPLPSSLRFSLNGTESVSDDINRRNKAINSYSMNLSRTMSGGWQPIPIFNGSFNQTVSSSRIREDSLRTIIAAKSVTKDSSAYWIKYTWTDEDSVEYVDSVFNSSGWGRFVEEEIARQKERIFWQALGADFVDNRLSQSFNFTFRPELFGWLGTDASYNSAYTWTWGTKYGAGDRKVKNSSRLSTGFTLRLPQIVSSLDNLFPDHDDDDSVPGGMDSGPSSGGTFEPAPGAFPPPGGGSTAGTPEMPQDLPDLPGGLDSLMVDTVKVEDEKPSLKIDVWTPVKLLLSKLRDVRYDYSQSNSVDNNNVEPGQADWKFRLGLTKNSGLGKVEGYSVSDGSSVTDEHRISSGLSITKNLAISSFDYSFSETENQSITRTKTVTGNGSRTAFYLFESDELTVLPIPAVNWTARWGGWENLPMLSRYANSISLDNSYRGSLTEQWEVSPDSGRQITRTEYSKSFSPLLGISFNWKLGISSSIRYNITESVTEGSRTKTKNNSRSITGSASYNLRRGFKLPFWPFKNMKLNNNTSFSLSYSNDRSERQQSTDGAPFASSGGKTESWSIAPSMDYSFSSTVRGSFRWEYAVRKSEMTGKTTSQNMGFSVNISIRG